MRPQGALCLPPERQAKPHAKGRQPVSRPPSELVSDGSAGPVAGCRTTCVVREQPAERLGTLRRRPLDYEQGLEATSSRPAGRGLKAPSRAQRLKAQLAGPCPGKLAAWRQPRPTRVSRAQRTSDAWRRGQLLQPPEANRRLGPVAEGLLGPLGPSLPCSSWHRRGFRAPEGPGSPTERERVRASSEARSTAERSEGRAL